MPHVRSIFVSDVHLGIRVSQAERLLDFLRAYTSDHLFLVGDIIDFQAIQYSIYWPPACNTVVQKILRRARHGQRIVFVPGNHDAAARAYSNTNFGAIRVAEEWVHTAANGRNYLLVHGDCCDPVTGYNGLLARIGDIGYTLVLHANRWLLWARRKLKLRGHWSLPGYAKSRIGRAQRYVREFEEAVARLARSKHVDGVICGHIHVPAAKHLGGVEYLNCGDWVESLTAIVEHHDGGMELVHWGNAAAGARLSPAQAGEAALAT